MSNIMAKKIKIVENSITNNEIIKKNKKYDFFRVSTPIFIVLLLISICINIVMYNKYNKTNNKLVETKEKLSSTKKELSSTEDELEQVSSSLFSIIGGEYSVPYINNKLYFLDNYIVIVPEYSNYYYTYDCFKELYPNSRYWAFNIDAAKGRGYKQGTC